MKMLGSHSARADWRSARAEQTRCLAMAMSRSRSPASRSDADQVDRLDRPARDQGGVDPEVDRRRGDGGRGVRRRRGGIARRRARDRRRDRGRGAADRGGGAPRGAGDRLGRRGRGAPQSGIGRPDRPGPGDRRRGTVGRGGRPGGGGRDEARAPRSTTRAPSATASPKAPESRPMTTILPWLTRRSVAGVLRPSGACPSRGASMSPAPSPRGAKGRAQARDSGMEAGSGGWRTPRPYPLFRSSRSVA